MSSIFDTDVQYLKGVGERRAAVLKDAGIHTFYDLLRYFPRRYLDRSTVTPIRSLRDGDTVTVVGTIRAKGVVPGKRMQRFEMQVQDESSGTLKCVWFRGFRWISTLFKTGERIAFHGKVQQYGSQFSMTHPDFDKLDSDGPALDTGRIIALYPGSAKLEKVGFNSRTFRRLIYGLFKEHGLEMVDLLPQWLSDQYQLIDGRVALRAIHFPKSQAELSQARERLKIGRAHV